MKMTARVHSFAAAAADLPSDSLAEYAVGTLYNSGRCL
jgi:hypothetical protein